MADKGRKKKFPRWAKIVIAVFIILWVIFLVGYSWVMLNLNKINKAESSQTVGKDQEYFETNEDEQSYSEMDPDAVQWASDMDIMKDKDVVNILLIGQDRRPGETRARSDSMIIATINKKTKSIRLTSLMRDLYVQIPGYSDNRINAAYAFGGMELLDETIEKNFAVHIDGNIEVDFDGFTEVINIIDGVDIDLYQAEADHLNGQNSSWNLKAGVNHLNGEQALAYARIRYVGNSDYERTDRQRRVLMEVFNKMKSISISEMLELSDTIFPLLTTDLSNTDLIGYGVSILKMGGSEIETYRIPGDGAYTPASIRGMSVLVPDLEKNRELLHSYIFD